MEVEMDVSPINLHHHQEICSKTVLEESMLACTKAQEDKKQRPPAEEAVKCPRCDSSNTKFCYYNNYSLTQPRYFCKSCRRYWTKGGTLRNVPVGGGCRKNKRTPPPSSSNSPSTSPPSKIQHPPLIPFITPNSTNHLFSGLCDSTSTDLANGFMGYDLFDHSDQHLGGYSHVDHMGFLDENTNTNNPNRVHHNVLCHGVNLGTGYIHDQEQQQQQILNPMFLDDHQEQEISSSAATTAGMLWGFPWQNAGNMVHDQIGGWNGIGSTNWHGLINSPLM